MATTDATLNAVALSTAVPSAKVLEVRRPLLGRRRHSDIDIPGRAGSVRFDEQPGDRELGLVISIEAATFALRRAAVRDLAEWADPGTTAQLIIDDEADRYHEAIIAGDDVTERLLAGDAELRFTVGPYTFAVATSSESVTATGSPDSGSFTIPDTVYAEPVIELTPTGGTLTWFTLTVNGYAITWAGGTIVAGDTITISSLTDTVTLGPNDDTMLTGAYDPADLDMADVSGRFPLLLTTNPQTWVLDYDGTATAVRVDFTWRERSR